MNFQVGIEIWERGTIDSSAGVLLQSSGREQEEWRRAPTFHAPETRGWQTSGGRERYRDMRGIPCGYNTGKVVKRFNFFVELSKSINNNTDYFVQHVNLINHSYRHPWYSFTIFSASLSYLFLYRYDLTEIQYNRHWHNEIWWFFTTTSSQRHRLMPVAQMNPCIKSFNT